MNQNQHLFVTIFIKKKKDSTFIKDRLIKFTTFFFRNSVKSSRLPSLIPTPMVPRLCSTTTSLQWISPLSLSKWWLYFSRCYFLTILPFFIISGWWLPVLSSWRQFSIRSGWLKQMPWLRVLEKIIADL